MTTKALCESLRWRADLLHRNSHKCPLPPCPFEDEAAELRSAADEIERSQREVERLRDALERIYQHGRGPHVGIAREALDS